MSFVNNWDMTSYDEVEKPTSRDIRGFVRNPSNGRVGVTISQGRYIFRGFNTSWVEYMEISPLGEYIYKSRKNSCDYVCDRDTFIKYFKAMKDA